MIEPIVPPEYRYLSFFLYAASDNGDWIDQIGDACGTLAEAVAAVPAAMKSDEFLEMDASQIRIQLDVVPSLDPFKAEYDGLGNLLWVHEGFERYFGVPLTMEEREGQVDGDALARIG